MLSGSRDERGIEIDLERERRESVGPAVIGVGVGIMIGAGTGARALVGAPSCFLRLIGVVFAIIGLEVDDGAEADMEAAFDLNLSYLDAAGFGLDNGISEGSGGGSVFGMRSGSVTVGAGVSGSVGFVIFEDSNPG
jgi:hypothetical protein